MAGSGKRKTEGFSEEETEPATKKHKKLVLLRNKTLFIGNLSRKTKISDIIKFFIDVGHVFRIQLPLNYKGKLLGRGYVEFASAKEANKALQEKNGKCLNHRKITLQVAKNRQRHRYCIDHKVCYSDYLQREGLLIGNNERADNAQEVAVTNNTLFVANLSPQTKISDINEFFNDELASVRLIVNHENKHMGYGFVEFDDPQEASKALKYKNCEYLHGHKIFLQFAEIAPGRTCFGKEFNYLPLEFGIKSTMGESFWMERYFSYEDYVRRDSSLTAKFLEAAAVRNKMLSVGNRKKTLSIGNLSPKTKISDIIDFFKDVGEIFHVRLILNHNGEHVDSGYVEFASADGAKKALQEKNKGTLLNKEISVEKLRNAMKLVHKYCIDHKPWHRAYIRREADFPIQEDESFQIEDKAAKGPAELLEEVVLRKKTLFISDIIPETKILNVFKFAQSVANVVSVRLIVNDDGEHVGSGYLEFASADEARKALKMDGEILQVKKTKPDILPCKIFFNHTIFLQEVEVAPYIPRPRWNLVEMQWYEGYRRLDGLDLINEDEANWLC